MNTAPAASSRAAVLTAAVCAVVLAAAAPAAWGFGFGEPQVSSAIGQPLRLRIPLRVDPDGELSAQCVRLIGSSGSDAIPTMTMAMARISIERRGDERILRIDSASPINEPVLRVSVEAGCAQHARREFVLLLDPPETLPQLAVTAPSVGASVAAASPPHDTSTQPAADAASSLATGTDATPTGAEAAAGAAPLVLGAATITGHVGQALSLQVPVTGTAAGALEAGCVRLAGAWTGEGAPVLSQARLAVVRNADGTQIDLLTSNPVTVPALRVVLEAGCAVTARREYLVNLEPATVTDAAEAQAEPAADTATRPAAAPAALATATPAAPADTPSPAPARPVRKIPAKPPVPEQLAMAPVQSPAAAAAPATPPASKATPAARPKAATPAADRLVLAAPADQPDPAAQRIAEMDKRIADLTHEVALLRDEMAADRQRAAETADAPARLSTGWIVAIIALLGLGISGLISLQRKRSGMPWEKPAWEPSATVMPDAGERTRMGMPAAPREAAGAPAAAAPAAQPDKAPRVAPPSPPPPLPRTGPLAAFEELTGTTSTLTPDPGGPQTRIEVTELHADDPEIGKMHTVFLEPGNFDAPPLPPAGPIETRIPGPRPTTSGAPAPAAGATAVPLAIAPLPPIVELPPMPAPPTVVAPDQRHGAFTFDEGPYTQTPTMLVLDLDLTTRALPPEEAEIARFAEAAQKIKDGKDGEAGLPGGAEARNGYKNGH